MSWIIAFIIAFIIFSIFTFLGDKQREVEREISMAEERRKQELEVLVQRENERLYRELENKVLEDNGFFDWNLISYFDEYVTVSSRQTLEKYDDIKFFKENREKLAQAERVIKRKDEVEEILRHILQNEEYQSHSQYNRLKEEINRILSSTGSYRIKVQYITSAGNNLGSRVIMVDRYRINKLKSDKTLLMGKVEYNKYLKEKQKEALTQKSKGYYDRINNIIDYANKEKDRLIIKGDKEKLDDLIVQLFDRTVNSIKKIKALDSEEWDIVGDFINWIKSEIDKIVKLNQQIQTYYESSEFFKIKETCEVLMGTQREFNEYIEEKVQAISKLFGAKVVRNETVNKDEYQYIRPYKKTVTPFTAEVSATVFSSAENNPIEYIVKNFYPYKGKYPEQIQKLYQLVEELETLRDAKQIIENYKEEYQQYLGDVPDFIMKNDKDGFYRRLGFADIDENVLAVEYKFSYTSNGGMAKRSFTVPMTEETIPELIKALEDKLTASNFAKEQRTLMTRKLRESIKKRDNFTCCHCGNSIYKEPNLLLEIDHIRPIAKGGYTIENNLQTLCWKCNRSKRDKYTIDEEKETP